MYHLLRFRNFCKNFKLTVSGKKLTSRESPVIAKHESPALIPIPTPIMVYTNLPPRTTSTGTRSTGCFFFFPGYVFSWHRKFQESVCRLQGKKKNKITKKQKQQLKRLGRYLSKGSSQRTLWLFEYRKSLLRTPLMFTASTNQMKSPKCEKLYQGKDRGKTHDNTEMSFPYTWLWRLIFLLMTECHSFQKENKFHGLLLIAHKV